MIPVALPSVEAALTVLAFFAVTLLWTVWTLYLAWHRWDQWKSPPSSPVKRSWVQRLIYIGFTVVALFTIGKTTTFCLEFAAYKRIYNAEYRPILQEPQNLGGIDMPVGTQLELAVAKQRPSFRTAQFPSPVIVAGIQALRVERYVSIQTDDQYQVTAYVPQMMHVTGIETVKREGWVCDATQPVSFTLTPDDTAMVFESCILAAGNVFEGAGIPVGSQVSASTGNVYLDGFVDEDRWVISVADDAEMRVNGLSLRGPVLALDSKRQLLTVDRTVLGQDLRFGTIDYLAGTTIRYNPKVFRANYPRTWVLQAPVNQNSADQQVLMVHECSGRLLARVPSF